MKEISGEEFDKLERLLTNKQFSELLPDEQQWVFQFLSEDEYREMAAFYLILADEAANVSEIEPSPHSKTKLDLVLEQSDSRKKYSFFNIRIPVYQSVAACIIFFLLGFGIQYYIQPKVADQNPNIVMVEEKDISPQETSERNTDRKTSGLEIKQIFKESQKKDLPKSNGHKILTREKPEASYLKTLAEHNIKQVREESTGCSLGNDSVIQKLLVTIY